MPDRNRRRWTAAAATVAVAGGITAAALLNRPRPPAAVAPSGSVVTVRSAADLRSLRSNTTYRWASGYVHRQQLSLKSLAKVTLENPRIDGASESNIYAVGVKGLTIRGGSLTNSRTKSGILFEGDGINLTMVGVTCTGNGEHGVYIASGANDGFEIKDCILSQNKRCGLQINPEIGGDRIVKGGKITGCTIKGNARSQGAALNLGSWQDGLLSDCTIEGNAKGPVLWKGDGAAACRNVRIEKCRFKSNGGDSLRFIQGSTGRLVGNTFDKKPAPGGWTSGPPSGTNRGPGSATW